MKKHPKPQPELAVEDGLTAEQVLVGFLDRIGWDGREVVRELFAVHAHELAEKQRRWADEENFILPTEVDGRDVPTMDIPPHMSPADALYELGFSRKDAQTFVDWHAHHLAEKQRAWLRFQGYGPSEQTGDGDCPCGGCSWCLAQDYIDLIDPEAPR